MEEASGGVYRQNVTCTLPALPAGTWPVRINVDGYGNARGALSSPGVELTLQYGVAVSRVSSVPTTTAVNIGSFLGGSTFTISGFGLANSNLQLNKTNRCPITHSPSNRRTPAVDAAILTLVAVDGCARVSVAGWCT